jgi:murein DD-endopeptidase MepM/ murein hydrolase activator NlpD
MRAVVSAIGRAVVVALVATARAAVAQQIPPSIEFRVPKTPTIAVSDSGAFVAYELHVTNLTSMPMRLRRVEVLDADNRTVVVSTLADTALLRAVARPAPAIPVAQRLEIGAGLRAYVYLWIPVSRATAPTRLTHRLTLQRIAFDTTVVGKDTSIVVLEGTTIPVEREAIVISPPVRGEWAAFNGPSNASGHRRLVLALDGHVASGQRFAIDYLQVDSTGSSRHGDASDNKNYYAYGTELLAVADGIVVATKDSIPENVPGGRAVPITLVTVGGNYVGIDVGKGRYALYAHVQPHSLRVKVGDRVKRGQVIALLGNSGNSTEPHVHFQIADGPTFLSSEGLPYALESFEVFGRCGIDNGPPPAIKCSRGAPVTVKNGMPLQNELVRFPK